MSSLPAWRVPPLHVAPAAEQLALTEVLWQAVASGAAGPTLRWYSYSGAAVVLGVSQRPADAIDEVAARAQGIEVVRRSSGGAAVLADPSLLALDAALPAGHPLAAADVVEAYRWLGAAFLAALAALAPARADRLELVSVAASRADQVGVREAAGGPRQARSLACFGTLSPYEVGLRRPDGVVAKLVGLSQLRKRGVVLFQAGVYAAPAVASLAQVLRVPAESRAALVRELRRRTASLDELDLSAFDWPRLMAGVQAALNNPAMSS